MDLRPLNYFDPDSMCNFEMFGLSNTAMVPVMIAMTPGVGVITNAGNDSIQQQQQQQQQQQLPQQQQQQYYNQSHSVNQHQQQQHHQQQQQHINPLPTLHENTVMVQTMSQTTPTLPPPQYMPSSIVLPTKLASEQIHQFELASNATGSGIVYQKIPVESSGCPRHRHLQQPATTTQTQTHSQFTQTKTDIMNEDTSSAHEAIVTTCIPGFILGVGGGNSGNNVNGNNIGGNCNIGRETNDNPNRSDDCIIGGCNALMMMGIGVGNNTNNGGNSTFRRNTGNSLNRITFDDRLNETDYNKQPCNCTYMSFDNFMDYQTTGFGGLPDVTEHSNIRRAISRQNSISNSDSVEIATTQKSKKSLKSNRTNSNNSNISSNININGNRQRSKRKFCVFSFSLVTTLILIIVASMLAYQYIFMQPSRNSHEERLQIVRKILKEVPLVDGHNDFAWNVRKYAHSSLEILDLNHEFDHKTVWNRPTWSQTDIPRLKQGLVGAQIWSAFVPCDAQGLDAVQLALEQIDIIHRFAELHSSYTKFVTTSQEIIASHRKGLLASMIGIEGGHALGSSLAVLRSFHSLGARYLTLTHHCDISWAGSSMTSIDKGLTTFGKSVIKEMNRLGMMIDLSHSSDATARDVLDVTRAPVIFSHSAARHLCNTTRNIPDDILRSVADNGGLIMISFNSEYVSCGSPSSALYDVIAHIKYIRSIAGIQHIGIGAGYDGIEQTPHGLEDVSKYPNLLATLLEDNNWSDEDIAMLAGKNFLRVLKSVENVRDYGKRAAILPIETSEPIKKSQCTYMSS